MVIHIVLPLTLDPMPRRSKRFEVRSSRYLSEMEGYILRIEPLHTISSYSLYVWWIRGAPALALAVYAGNTLEVLDLVPVIEPSRALKTLYMFSDVLARDLFDGYLTDMTTFIHRVLRKYKPKDCIVEVSSSMRIIEGSRWKLAYSPELQIAILINGARIVLVHGEIPGTLDHFTAAVTIGDEVGYVVTPCSCSYEPLHSDYFYHDLLNYVEASSASSLEDIAKVFEDLVAREECLEPR